MSFFKFKFSDNYTIKWILIKPIWLGAAPSSIFLNPFMHLVALHFLFWVSWWSVQTISQLPIPYKLYLPETDYVWKFGRCALECTLWTQCAFFIQPPQVALLFYNQHYLNVSNPRKMYKENENLQSYSISKNTEVALHVRQEGHGMATGLNYFKFKCNKIF